MARKSKGDAASVYEIELQGSWEKGNLNDRDLDATIFDMIIYDKQSEMIEYFNKTRQNCCQIFREKLKKPGMTPLQLCCFLGRKEIAKAIVNYDVQLLFSSDSSGNEGAHGGCSEQTDKGILHLLVDASTKNPEGAMDMYNFVTKVLCSDTNRRRLLAEVYKGADPLVYAIMNGQLQMAHAIISEDVYKTVVCHHGSYRTVIYNISRYRYENRCYNKIKMSPIEAILSLGRKDLEDEAQRNVLLKKPWKKWMAKQWTYFSRAILLWVLIRVINLTVLTLYCVSYPIARWDANVTTTAKSGAVRKGSQIWLLTCASFALLFNGVQFFPLIRQHTTACYIGAKRLLDSIVSFAKPGNSRMKYGTVYWTLSNVMYLSIFIATILDVAKSSADRFMFSLAICTGFLSTLHFSFLVPSLGHFAVIVERTLIDILNFAVFYCFVLCGFGGAMYVIYQGSINEEHQEIFHTYARSLFSVFHMTFNPPEQNFLFTAPVPLMAVTLFVIYMLVAAILLMNFLIAIMNRTVEDIYTLQAVVFFLNRLSIVYEIANFPLYRALKNLKRRCPGPCKILRKNSSVSEYRCKCKCTIDVKLDTHNGYLNDEKNYIECQESALTT